MGEVGGIRNIVVNATRLEKFLSRNKARRRPLDVARSYVDSNKHEGEEEEEEGRETNEEN